MNSFTIGKKLYVGVVTLVVCMFALGASAVFSMVAVGNRLHSIVDKTGHKQAMAHQMDLDTSDMLAEDRGIIVRGFMKDYETAEKYNRQFAVSSSDFADQLKTIKPLLVRNDAKLLIEEMEQDLAPMREANQNVFEAAAAGDMSKALDVNTTVLLPLQKKEKAGAVRMLEIETELLNTDTGAADGLIDGSRWTSIVLLCLATAVGIVVIFVVRQINRTLRSEVGGLASMALEITSAADRFALSSESLAHSATEQAATIEETSSASTEIHSMAQRAAQNSQVTASIATDSQTSIERANQSLVEMTGAMEGINDSSKKISNILKVIDGIAFQTSILSLNAAVEAARAGDAGAGFAVVADEVRSLAEKCKVAAKDTADLIENSLNNSKDGRAKVEQVAASLHLVTDESKKIKGLVDEIHGGSIEQSQGIQQISKAISQLESVTQRSAATAEEGSADAMELQQQAKIMKESVERLSVMVDGSAAKPAHNIFAHSQLRSA